MTFKTFHLSSVPFRNQRLIVAVSGGLDSMALLHLLMELSKEGGFGLIAAHVNYGLRGKDSRLDEEHVRHFCREHKVPFRCLRLNASKKDFRVIHKSLQEWAREKRYGYFKRLAIREKAWGVAVAHHMEDQAETILDRILRGAGGKGLSGMRSFQELRFDPKLPPLKIWRPLLHFSKPDLEKYLDSQGVGWRQDKSNLKDVYRRNQIRSQVIPFLKKWNPRIVQTLSEIADITAEEDDLLETLTKDWESSSKPRVGKAEYGIDLKKSVAFRAPCSVVGFGTPCRPWNRMPVAFLSRGSKRLSMSGEECFPAPGTSAMV